MAKPIIHYEKLGDCDIDNVIAMCPTDVFDKEEEKIVVKRPEDCIACKACEVNAPEEAIVVIEED